MLNRSLISVWKASLEHQLEPALEMGGQETPSVHVTICSDGCCLWMYIVLMLNVSFLEITCNRKDYLDADIEGPSKSLYTYKEQVEYVCKKGYGGRFTLTCGNRRWMGTFNCKSK